MTRVLSDFARHPLAHPPTRLIVLATKLLSEQIDLFLDSPQSQIQSGLETLHFPLFYSRILINFHFISSPALNYPD